MLDKSKMTELDKLVNNSIVTYKDSNDYVKSNNLDKNDFLEWNKKGYKSSMDIVSSKKKDDYIEELYDYDWLNE